MSESTKVSIRTALEHLNLSESNQDAVIVKLQQAESVIAERVGPLVERVVTERVRGRNGLSLSVTPVLDLILVKGLDGAEVDTSALILDGGLVTYRDERRLPQAAYDVTYRAGWAREDEDLPAGLQLAVLELLRRLWASKRGAAVRPGTKADTDTMRPPGFLLPYAVEAALEPYEPVGGFA